MKPLVSVILPVYNAELTVAKAISSILNQTLTEFELIIINDGSTDNTLKVIDGFNDYRIRLFSTENRGVARAANFAIKLSSSNYIARMDADDESFPQRLQKQYDCLETNKDVDVVSCLVTYGGDKEKNEGYAVHVDSINQLITHQQMVARRFEDSPLANPSLMFRKSLIGKYGSYGEEHIPEDYELILRWMDKGVCFAKIDEHLFKWNDLKTRITRNYIHYSEENFDKIKVEYLVKYLHEAYDSIPIIWVWGTGRKINSKVNLLQDYGLTIVKYIDVKQNDHLPNRLHYSKISEPGKFIILSYVKDRKGKAEIIEYLNDKGFQEGRHYFLMN